jgi:S-adenosylmethionine hydrolase
LRSFKPEVLKNGKVKGRIVHIDRFGNCVTNIDRGVEVNQTTTVRVNGKAIESVREFYGEGKKRSKLFAIWGSAGFLEISARNRSAAKLLKAERGDDVVVVPFSVRQ